MSVVSFRAIVARESCNPLSSAPCGRGTGAQVARSSGQPNGDRAYRHRSEVAGAGAEPRQPLRLHPKPGDKQSLTMTTKMGMEMRMGEMPAQPVQMPSTRLVMDLTVKSVAENGDIDFDIVITDAGVVGSNPVPCRRWSKR